MNSQDDFISRVTIGWLGGICLLLLQGCETVEEKEPVPHHLNGWNWIIMDSLEEQGRLNED